ncbi:MAG: V-type ATP synthase subunit E family protein [Bacilli bacterium]
MNPVGNHTIYEKILQKGREESDQLLADGKKRAELIVDVAVQEEKKDLSIEHEKREIQFDETYKTKMTEFDQGMKQKSLLNKKQLLKDVFDAAHHELENRSDDELFRFVVHYMKKDVLTGTLALRVARQDYKRYLSLFSSRGNGTLDLLMKELPGDLTLTLDKETAPIQGGFLIIGDQFDIDYSYEAILQGLFDKIESEVASLLFTEESA